ncbi:MAG: AraC family transcriptional regulator [Roseovarius sp.]
MKLQPVTPLDEHSTASRPRYAGETVTSVSGESSEWHSHDFGQLVSSTSGSMYVGTSTHVLLLSPAMAIWIPPDAKHWMRTSSNNEMLYVDVNRDEAKELGMECRVIAMTQLLNALMTTTLPNQSNIRTPEHLKTLHDLIRKELVAAQDVPLSVILPQDKRIHGIAKAALSDPSLIVSVDTWLRDVAASRKTIERLFVSETGMPPSRWLRHVRLLHAVSQLAAGKKVSTVAFDMGYESASAFSYMFRRLLGVSPSQFCSDTALHRS